MTALTEHLDRLEKIAGAATPGPWEFDRVSFDGGDFCYERNDKHALIQIYEHNYTSPMHAKFDSAHIATFDPPTAKKLIETVRLAVGALEKTAQEKSYVESQSTGLKQYFETEGAEISQAALAAIGKLWGDA